MKTSLITSVLLAAVGCLAGHLGQAQQAPVAPLVPVTSVVAPPRLAAGVEVQTKRPAAPTPSATAPQNRPVIPEPVVILNGGYLTGMNALGTLNPQQIDKLEIYKSGGGPVQWRSLTAPGIISITLKSKPKLKLKAKSLAAIRRSLKLRGPARFEFNGAPIQDESLQIITSTIAGLDVTRATPGTAAEAVVNIRSVPSKRTGPQGVPAQSAIYPPGTIIIRGLAQQ